MPDFHPLANIFPMLQGNEAMALQQDIEAHGVREPIVLFEGKILDGRNRFTASLAAGVECPWREFGTSDCDGADPMAFVVSLNLARRHLTESQRAMVASKLANMQEGRPRNNYANLRSLSQQAAAEMLKVSQRSVTNAKKVQEHAPDEIKRAVCDGQLSVSLAADVVDLPDEAKADIIGGPPENVKLAAREAVKKAHVANNSGNNEWYTPAQFVGAARAVMGGIDLDPASSEIANETVQAARIFTANDNGLEQEWPVCRIWMNPPYAQPLMGQFAARFASEIRKGSEGVVLVNNATETAWFQEIAAECSAICFPKTRIRFLDPNGNPGAPLQGQAIIYCGKKAEFFEREFSTFGVVVRHG